MAGWGGGEAEAPKCGGRRQGCHNAENMGEAEIVAGHAQMMPATVTFGMM